jgi:hypothetical protein
MIAAAAGLRETVIRNRLELGASLEPNMPIDPKALTS